MFSKTSCVLVRAFASQSRSLSNRACPAAVPFAVVHTQRATLFTNAKKDYTNPEKPKDPADNFFNKDVGSESDIPAGHVAEQQLPSHKQLTDELPSAEEVERAIREGNVDTYVTEDGHDD